MKQLICLGLLGFADISSKVIVVLDRKNVWPEGVSAVGDPPDMHSYTISNR